MDFLKENLYRIFLSKWKNLDQYTSLYIIVVALAYVSSEFSLGELAKSQEVILNL